MLCESSQENERLTLRQSGWYYEEISIKESHELLKDYEVGTFLLRNSSDINSLYSLSIQTSQGPTSVRLCYNQGVYSLCSQPSCQQLMPTFSSVFNLVQHYIHFSKKYEAKDSTFHVFLNHRGEFYSSICLRKPLIKKSPLRLKHLARLAVNNGVQQTPRLQSEIAGLPQCLQMYLKDYPYLI